MGLVDPIESEFRSLVDGASPSFIGDPNDLVAVYNHFGLDGRVALSAKHVRQHLRERIVAVLKPGQPATWNVVRVLREQLLVRHWADDEPLEPYFLTIDTILNVIPCAACGLAPLADVAAWTRAIVSARDLIMMGEHRLSPQAMVSIHTRARAIAHSIANLRALGFDVAIKHARGLFSDGVEAAIAQRINDGIRKLGGISVADWIFEGLAAVFDSNQGRYHTVRRPRTSGARGTPSVPIGYLLNVCAKHSRAASDPHKATPETLRDVVELAKAYTGALDVEPHGHFDQMFHNRLDVFEFLQRAVVYDGLFGFVQGRPSDVAKTMRAAFAWVDPAEARRVLGWSIDDAARVAHELLVDMPVHDSHRAFAFTRDRLVKRLPTVDESAVRTLLRDLSHIEPNPNAGLLGPIDQTKIDEWRRPLLAAPDDWFVLLNRSRSAPAFYEAIASALRQGNLFANVDGQTGQALERFVRNELSAHGVIVRSGKYSVPGSVGECDVVVETASTIIFIEMKKKVLRRSTRSGDTVTLLGDLAGSLFDALKQSSEHAARVIQHGSLRLTNSEGAYDLRHDGRAVERVALTHLDFGCLQDRTVIWQLLEALIGADVKAIVAARQPEVDNAQRSANELAIAQQSLDTQRGPRPGRSFFDTWFLSLGHLQVVLDNVTDNESFCRELLCTRHVTTGALDFYFEYAQKKGLES